MKQGWTYKKLGEVCRIERGGSPRPIKDFITQDSNGLNWIKIGDTDPQGKYIYSTKEKIKPEGLRKSRWVEEDEFLLSNSMSFGRPYILKTNGCIHDGWLVLRDYQKNLFIDFFYYMLLSSNVQKQFKSKAQGSTVSNLNTDRVASVSVSFPSIQEQQRIVSRLDSAFAHIDELKANAEKQLSEARALFQKSLDKALCNDYWKKTTLNEICIQITDGTHRTPKYTTSGIPFLSVKNVTSGIIDMSNSKFISKEEHNEFIKRCNPKYGDILYTKVGTTGVAKIIDVKQEFSIFVSLALLKINESAVFNRFLEYVLNSPYVYKQSQKLTSGAANRNFLLNDIKKVELFIPTLSEQQRIVSRLDSLSAHVRELEEVLQKTIAECDALKQALLRKVFE